MFPQKPKTPRTEEQAAACHLYHTLAKSLTGNPTWLGDRVLTPAGVMERWGLPAPRSMADVDRAMAEAFRAMSPEDRENDLQALA